MKDLESVGIELRNLSITIKRAMQEVIDNSSKEKITKPQGMIIGFLAHNQDKKIFQKDIENYLNVRRSTVSEMLSVLQKKEYIKRVSVNSDARLKMIVLTYKAMKLNTEIGNRLQQFESKMIKDFSTEEIQEFLRLTKKIQNNLCSND